MRISLILSIIAIVFLAASVQASLDTSFRPGNTGDGLVETVLYQPDGKVLLSGNFMTFNGENKGYVVRLHNNGSTDQEFYARPGYWVRHMSLQPDGKIIIGGFFTNVEGVERNRIARLHQNGSLDLDFDVGQGAEGTLGISITGNPDPFVFATAVQQDGKVLIGGNFVNVSGVRSPGIARLHSNGSIDHTFIVERGVNSWVRSIVIQPDGKILVSGWFSEYQGRWHKRLMRLNIDGTADENFNPEFDDYRTAVYTMSMQPDGKIVIGGHFSNVSGIARESIARLEHNGSLDHTFDVGSGANDFVQQVAVQSDGKILLVGYFSAINGQPASRVARLHENGSLDTNLYVNPDNFVWSAAFDPNNKVLIGGGFGSVDGVPYPGVARINAAHSIIDKKAPSVRLTSPEVGMISYETTHILNCTVSDEGKLKGVTLYVWNSTSSYYKKAYKLNSTHHEVNWTLEDLKPGTYAWTCVATDMSGNVLSYRPRSSFSVLSENDTTPPIVSLIYPANRTYTRAEVPVKFIMREPGICEYSLNRGVNNHSMSMAADRMTFSATAALSPGSYGIRVYCKDMAGNPNLPRSRSFSVIA